MAEKSLWDKTKEQASKAADATKRATQKLTHLAVISDKKRRIANAKLRYGVAIYDAFDIGDQVFAEQCFLELREKIAALEQAIVDKETQILSECDPKYVSTFVPTSIATHEASKTKYPNYPPVGPLPLAAASSGPSSAPTPPCSPALAPHSQKHQQESKNSTEDGKIDSPSALQHHMKPKMAGGGKRTRGTAPPTQEALLEWAQTTLKGFNGVQVTDLSKSWVNGMAFAALVCNFEPQAVTLSVLDPKKGEANLRVVFDAAETCGVAVLLDPEDMATADEKSICSTVSMFYRTFSTSTPSEQGRASWNARFPQ